jgi:TonB family protein
MSLVVSIAREEPLCIKASADAAAAWGRNEKGYGFSDHGTIVHAGGRSFEITLLVAVRPNANSSEFAQFPRDLEISGHLHDDGAPVGVFTVKQGKATVAIMVPALQGELELNVDEPIELDRVVLATGTGAHLRMIASIRACPAPAQTAIEPPAEIPLLVHADIAVAVQGTSRASGSAAGRAGARTSETFIEQTTTAIIFAHGAIVRLAESVAPGQILILRRLASDEESACRVVTVKPNPNAKGYVELEFLQPAPKFWGTALTAPSAGKSPSASSAVAARPEPAAASPKNATAPRAGSHTPAARPITPVPTTAKSAPATAARNVFSKLLDVPAAIGEVFLREAPKAAEPKTKRPAHAAAEAASDAPTVTQPAPAILAAPEAAPSAQLPVAPQSALDGAVPVIIVPDETEPAPTLVSVEAAPADIVAQTVAAEPAAIETMSTAQPDEAMRSPLAEVAGPAIAEPPAIEPMSATSASETTVESESVDDTVAADAAVATDTATNATEPASIASAADLAPIASRPRVTPARGVEPSIAPARAARPVLSGGGELLSGEKAFAWNKNDRPKRSRATGIAIAAAVILALAGGVGFYLWQQQTKLDSSVAASSQPILATSTSAATPDSGSAPVAGAPLSGAQSAAGATPTPATAGSPAASATGIATPARSPRSAVSSQPAATAGSAAANPRPTGTPESKSQFARGPEVAEMRITAPTAAARSNNQATPAIATDVPTESASASASGMLSDTAQPDRPATPPPVRMSSGAQQPRLLSGAAPVYPYAARAEKVEGDVSVDLLIDETGKVARMTVLSGPALLREAALDALRHRKYLPAVLDGRATAAHITVVIHFQL